MIDWADKTNNEIIVRLKEMENEYSIVKNNIILEYDKMIELEKDFKLGNEALIKRLKRDI